VLCARVALWLCVERLNVHCITSHTGAWSQIHAWYVVGVVTGVYVETLRIVRSRHLPAGVLTPVITDGFIISPCSPSTLLLCVGSYNMGAAVCTFSVFQLEWNYT
jgi:hypothetical protein